jgi:hypothetical protein
VPNRLWFAVPPGRIRATPVRLGGTNLAIDGDDVWLINVLGWSGPDPLAEDGEVASMMGSAIESAAYVAALRGARLPAALELWGTARNVPADQIGPGSPSLVTIDGRAQLAAHWDFGPVRATYTVVQDGHLGILAPVDLAPVRLQTVPELPA